MRTSILKVTCVLLAVLLVFAGCSKKENPTPTTTVPQDANYCVEVVSEGGKVLSDAEIRVYKDGSLANLQSAGRTDENGMFVFTAPKSEDYHVVVRNVPAGYVCAEKYPLTGEYTRVELKTQLQTDVNFSTHKVNLGDVMFEFTVTDCDGKQHTLSSLLEEKDAVILNFWYEGCAPCKQEFPHFQEAYEKYGDRVALLALNTVDDDEAAISAFQKANGLTFPMVKAGQEWKKVFSKISYPTTLVIDRFGTVSLMHTGTITESAVVDRLFSYFIAEDYKQHTVSGMEELMQGVEVCQHLETEVRNAKAASCTAEGYSGDTYCKACDEKLESGVEQPKVPHSDSNEDNQCDSCGTETGTCSHSNTEVRNEKKATCTAAGYTGDTYCKTCGDLVKNGSAVSATGHKETEVRNRKEVTCEADGYTGDTYCKTCGKKLESGASVPKTGHKDDNDDCKCDACGTAVAPKITYTVTVVNVDGLSTKGITVKLGTYTALTNESGVATFNIPSGTYTLSLPDLNGFKVYDQPETLSANQTTGEVSLTTIVPEGYDIVDGQLAKFLTTGSNSVTLNDGELTYILFRPVKSGVYSISSGYTLRYYGNNLFFIQDLTDTLTDYATTSFSIEVKEGHLGGTYLIGVKAPAGVTGVTVTITRTGDVELTWAEKEYTAYAGTYTPKAWTFGGGNLTYIDITGDASNFTLVLGSDGYYHLNSADGPLLYLNLKGGAYLECALDTMLNSNRPIIQGYVKDDNGEILSKEMYNDLVQQYIDCASEGLYRLTPDLVRILKTQNENWYAYLSAADSKVNPEITWMCNICYVA